MTINEDATFQTYDEIFLNLIMKSDDGNNNSILVLPYSEVRKKQRAAEDTSKRQKSGDGENSNSEAIKKEKRGKQVMGKMVIIFSFQ